MNYTWNVMISWLLLQFLVPAQSSFQEEILVSSSNYMSCGRNTAIRIVDLKVQQYTTSCLETKHCNLTDQQRSAIKTGCNEKRSCTISEIIPNSCVVNDFGHVSVSYSCKGTVKSSCTFENGFCDWTIEGNDRYTWTIWSGETSEDDTGPDRDHTTASAYGQYMYTRSTNESRLDDESDMFTGWIVSSPKQCLTFWYHMHGNNIHTLKVFQLNDKNTIDLWSISFNQGNKWYLQSLALQDIGHYRIQFKATRGSGYKSEIALDDVIITNTFCKKEIDCTFETGQCGWQTEGTSYKWRNWHGRTPSSSTGPNVDHTLGTRVGGYIYLEASGTLSGQMSNLTSETVYPAGDECFTFWYYMYGRDMGTLNVYFDSENVSTISWSKSGNIGQRWLSVSLNISSSKPYQIVFEGIRGQNTKGDIALDDIALLPGLCKEVIDCSFETGQCGWHIEDTSYNWTNWHGSTPSSYTGPDVDHTLGTSTGEYIYLEASGQEKGQISHFTSRTVYPDDDACFTFWYYMYGKDMGTLNVYYDFEDVSTLAWSKSGNIAEKWLLASLNTSSSKQYKIIFEGIRGNASKGDIALDDIALLPGLCEEALSLDCSFEKGKCYWSTDTETPYVWEILAGRTPTYDTGPDNDHTSGLAEGQYIYLEGTYAKEGMTSELTSKTISPYDDACFSFWYHMYGKNIGTLTVYTEAGNIRKRQWSLDGNQGNEWMFANFTISESEPFRIIFEGIRGDSYRSDIALDDISLLDRTCSGLIKSSQTCNNIDESISLHECSKYYLQVNDTSLVFEREIDNCSGVYQHVRTSTTTLCNDMANSDICTFYLPELIMEDKRCFQSNWLSVEYTCEAVDTSTVSPIFASTKGSSEAEQITTYASVATSNEYVYAVVISTSLIIIVAVLVFTVIVCHFKKRSTSSKLCDNHQNTSVREMIDSSGYNIINYNKMTGINISNIDKNSLKAYLTNRQPQNIGSAMEQEDTFGNTYESLSTNRNSAEHTYESDPIHNNQYQTLTTQRESDKHVYESTEPAKAKDSTNLNEQKDEICNKYESLSTNRNSAEHSYESAAIHTNQYQTFTKQQESDKHFYESTEPVQAQDIKIIIEQEDDICNKCKSLSTNLNPVEHVYESDSIHTN